jgi:hypothetical protein
VAAGIERRNGDRLALEVTDRADAIGAEAAFEERILSARCFGV